MSIFANSDLIESVCEICKCKVNFYEHTQAIFIFTVIATKSAQSTWISAILIDGPSTTAAMLYTVLGQNLDILSKQT